MDDHTSKVRKFGGHLVDFFHYLALFVIGATVVWSAAHEYLNMMQKGFAGLEDILLLFIYLELGAMLGVYFRTQRLPVQFLIFIAITALSRHLVIDVQHVSTEFNLYLLLTISGCILIASGALYILALATTKFGRPEDNIKKDP